ncbi:MAG: helix-turn-helix transcriptional regulator [Parachlamydiaceae bacterium]|nr:helix-turn-helix transcriptional regulator [Parachlamydiaceae bacterium]
MGGLRTVSSVPSHIKAGEYVGPALTTIKTDGKRDKYKHELNQTASLTDTVFGTVIKAKTEAERKQYKDPVYLINQYEEAIEEHVDARVGAFLQQLVSCFGTRLHFSVGPTLDQAESAKTLKLQYKGKEADLTIRNAAHSSTFPCLLACSGSDWEEYQNGDEDAQEPESVVFLKGSGVYDTANTTRDLPRAVNEADIALDGSQHNSPFSQKALELLNEVSYGKITLASAMRKFVNAALNQIETAIPQKREGVKRSLEIFKEYLIGLKKEMADNDEWVFTQLNLDLDKHPATEDLKKMMLRVRAKAIRTNMQTQSNINTKISKVYATYLKTLARKPPQVEAAFRASLIDSLTVKADKLRVQKLLGFPLEFFKERLTKRQKNLFNSAMEKLNEGFSKEIKSLAKDVTTSMRSARTAEQKARGDAVRSLRFGKKWTQVELGKRLKKKYPNEPASGPTISRSETGVRDIDLALATKFSEVFKIPPGLLVAQNFSD